MPAAHGTLVLIPGLNFDAGAKLSPWIRDQGLPQT